MVQAMDHAVEGYMDQEAMVMVQAMDEEAVEGDIWIRKLLKEHHEAVEGDMDQGAIEGDIDGASDERSDRWYKQLWNDWSPWTIT